MSIGVISKESGSSAACLRLGLNLLAFYRLQINCAPSLLLPVALIVSTAAKVLKILTSDRGPDILPPGDAEAAATGEFKRSSLTIMQAKQLRKTFIFLVGPSSFDPLKFHCMV